MKRGAIVALTLGLVACPPPEPKPPPPHRDSLAASAPRPEDELPAEDSPPTVAAAIDEPQLTDAHPAGAGLAAPTPLARDPTEREPLRVIGVGPVVAPGDAPDARGFSLRAVRRVLWNGQVLCTGTLIRRRHPRVEHGLLTAAHCFFAIDPDGRLGDRRAGITVEGVRTGALGVVRIGRSFATCVSSTFAFSRCLDEGAADIAFVPIEASALEGQPVWSECTAPPPDQELVAYGFGMRRVGSRLIGGRLALDNRGRAGPWSAVASSHSVVFGDSGGPVVTARDDDQMARFAPRVCFTTSAIRHRALEDPTGETARALLQPAWDLESRLAP